MAILGTTNNSAASPLDLGANTLIPANQIAQAVTTDAVSPLNAAQAVSQLSAGSGPSLIQASVESPFKYVIFAVGLYFLYKYYRKGI